MWQHSVQCQWNPNPNTRICDDSTTYTWPTVTIRSSIGCNYASIVAYATQSYPTSPIGCTPCGTAKFMYIQTLTLIGHSTTKHHCTHGNLMAMQWLLICNYAHVVTFVTSISGIHIADSWHMASLLLLDIEQDLLEVTRGSVSSAQFVHLGTFRYIQDAWRVI